MSRCGWEKAVRNCTVVLYRTVSSRGNLLLVNGNSLERFQFHGAYRLKQKIVSTYGPVLWLHA